MDTAPNQAHPIPLARLRANEQYQPRDAGLDARHVQLLAASDPETWPPLLVTTNEVGGFDLLDGFHRVAAASKLGLTEILAIIDPDAGYPEAVEANLRHGLPLPIADRKTFARWLHEQEPTLSLRELGRRSGLNHETVGRALSEPDDGSGDEQNRPKRASDPIRALVRQVDRAYQAGHGRAWLGFGAAGNPKPFVQALLAYDDDDRPQVARSLKAFGDACVLAAASVLAKQDAPSS